MGDASGGGAVHAPAPEAARERASLQDYRGRRGAAPPLALVGPSRTPALLLLLALGMLVVVALVGAVPLYTGLAAQAQVQYVLRSAPSYDTNVDVSALIPGANTGTESSVEAAGDELRGFLAPFVAGYTLYLESAIPLQLAQVDGKAPDAVVPALAGGVNLEALAYDYADAGSHMRLLAGRLPRATPRGDPVEVLATPQLGVGVGDALTLAYTPPGFAPGIVPHQVPSRVVGVWQPRDARDPFWNGRSFDKADYDTNTSLSPEYPLLFDRDGFLTHFGLTYLPNGDPTGETPGAIAHLVFFIARDRITVANLQDAQAGVSSLRRYVDNELNLVVGGRGAAVATRLDTLLEGVSTQLTLLAQPLAIVVAQVVGLALLFIAAMAGLLVEGQAGEIAVLRSRGASDAQVLVGFAAQGLALAAAAVALGPALAAGLSLALVRAAIPSVPPSALATYLASTLTLATVLRPAVLGAGLGLAALLLAAWRAARRDVLAFRREQGRSEARPSWRRYHLDLALAGLCAVGYLQLDQVGGLDVRTQLDQPSAAPHGPDVLAVAAPALLVLAGALIALRLFPLLAALGTRLAARRRGPTGLLVFAQAARGTAQYGRVTLVLTLAVAFGFFALTYRASLREDAAARAAFANGADVRVLLQGDQAGAAPAASWGAQLAAVPHVRAATPIYRGDFSTPGIQGGIALGLVGIDPATFARAALWRDEYAARPLADLLADMRAHAQGALAGDAHHPIWALVDPVCAAALHLHPGERFVLAPAERPFASLTYVVGGTVSMFPTMDDSLPGGYVVADLPDTLAALDQLSAVGAVGHGPTEYWLRTDGRPVDAAIQARAQAHLRSAGATGVVIVDRRAVADELLTSPLTAGMVGLLLAGAGAAVVLAVLGNLAEAAAAARRRGRQFAVLRTLGMSGRQLAGGLLLQQALVYTFALVVGTALGALLTGSTLPYLQFGDALSAAFVGGGPAPAVAFDPASTALFYAALLAAALAGLGLSAGTAARAGLGRALRVGED